MQQPQQPGKILRWLKASDKKPPEGIDGQLLHINPFKKLDAYYNFMKTYCALIFMGKHDGGLAWHWYEGPNSGWHTKISPEDFAQIEWLEETEDLSAPASPVIEIGEQKGDFQNNVKEWVEACFGKTVADDRMERNFRFLEEALELVQANGCSKEDCYKLVDYVFGRPMGELKQEMGGVMVTLAALGNACVVSMEECGQNELARVWGKIEQIRAKQASKKIKSDPLPGPSHPAPAPIVGEEADVPDIHVGDIPEQRTSLTQRFSADFYLKVSVTSDLIPENQGNVRANISTGIYAAFSGPGWRNTGVSVKEINNPETK